MTHTHYRYSIKKPVLEDPFVQEIPSIITKFRELKGRNPFVVMEGADGVGKSLLVNQTIRLMSWKAVRINFPTYTENTAGGAMRSLLNSEKESIFNNPVSYASLTAIDRQQAQKRIDKELERNAVIADRYVDSSVVYTAAELRNILSPERVMKDIYDFEYGMLKNRVPDITFTIDLSEEDHMRLLNDRLTVIGGDKNDKNSELQNKVRGLYHSLFCDKKDHEKLEL